MLNHTVCVSQTNPCVSSLLDQSIYMLPDTDFKSIFISLSRLVYKLWGIQIIAMDKCTGCKCNTVHAYFFVNVITSFGDSVMSNWQLRNLQQKVIHALDIVQFFVLLQTSISPLADDGVLKSTSNHNICSRSWELQNRDTSKRYVGTLRQQVDFKCQIHNEGLP